MGLTGVGCVKIPARSGPAGNAATCTAPSPASGQARITEPLFGVTEEAMSSTPSDPLTIPSLRPKTAALRSRRSMFTLDDGRFFAATNVKKAK